MSATIATPEETPTQGEDTHALKEHMDGAGAARQAVGEIKS